MRPWVQTCAAKKKKKERERDREIFRENIFFSLAICS
jgi:hypothetical protein